MRSASPVWLSGLFGIKDLHRRVHLTVQRQKKGGKLETCWLKALMQRMTDSALGSGGVNRSVTTLFKAANIKTHVLTLNTIFYKYSTQWKLLNGRCAVRDIFLLMIRTTTRIMKIICLTLPRCIFAVSKRAKLLELENDLRIRSKVHLHLSVISSTRIFHQNITIGFVRFLLMLYGGPILLGS